MSEDPKLKLSIFSIVKRRRLTGGKICYVFQPIGESLTSKKEMWGNMKHDTEVYTKIRKNAGLEGEEGIQFEKRALQFLLSSEFVDGVKHEDEEVNSDEDGYVEESVTVSSNVVVRNFPKKAILTECETFLEQFEGVSMVKWEEVIVKKEATSQVFKKGSYEVTFINRESAVCQLARGQVWQESVVQAASSF
jgi:hypothetical protein